MRDKRDRGMTAEQRRDRPARGATFATTRAPTRR